MDASDRATLMAVFVEEVEQHLTSMEECLVTLEARPGDGELIAEIFRAAHTIKGGAMVVEAEALLELAHGVEDLLDLLRSRRLSVSAELVDILLESVDVLRSLTAAAARGLDGTSPAAEALAPRLRRLCDSAQAASSRVDLSEPADASELRREDRRSIRIDLAKLDRLLDLTGELVVARGKLIQALEDPRGSRTHALEVLGEAGRLYADLQELAMRARMVPLGATFRQHLRTVRTLARSAGKRVQLSLEGEDVEVDASMVEQLRDPLTHMVRNAVDHGIEAPALRQARGKAPCGTLRLSARHDGGSVVLTVEDDGAGLPRRRIAERARELGIVEPERLSDQALLELVFMPGFSTASTVTALSGRGVGMDVVRRSIEALQGSVTLESREGDGTTITLRVPLTLAIVQGFLVSVGTETYVIPQDNVLECLELPRAQDGGAVGVLSLRGEAVPYLRLRDVFELGGRPDARENVVIVQHEGTRAGIVVDRLLGSAQSVIKPTGKLFASIAAISGSTILGDGRVALIIGLRGLLKDVLQPGTEGLRGAHAPQLGST